MAPSHRHTFDKFYFDLQLTPTDLNRANCRDIRSIYVTGATFEMMSIELSYSVLF